MLVHRRECLKDSRALEQVKEWCKNKGEDPVLWEERLYEAYINGRKCGVLTKRFS